MTYELEPFTFDDRAPEPAPRAVKTTPPPAPKKGGAAVYALAGATLGLLGVAGTAMVLAALFTP